MDHYFTIEKPSQAEFNDRGSKFIAYAFAIDNVMVFKKQLQTFKKDHPKAVHHCFAYRIGTDGNNFRVSDDGEPSGCAGKPILAQLDSKKIVNAAVVVVRYFGGTLLGVPGLIHAYKTATALALQLSPISIKQIEKIYTLEFDYTLMNAVITVIKKFNCTIVEQEMQLFYKIKIGVPKNRESEVLYSLKEIPVVEIKAI